MARSTRTAAARRPGIDAVDWAREVAARGAGEILLTSMDRDGARTGFDLALTRAVVDAVDVPVIASGGVGSLADLVDGIARGRRRRGARRVDLPLRRVHDRAGEGGDGRGGHRGARCIDESRDADTRTTGLAEPHVDMDWLDQVKWPADGLVAGDRAGRGVRARC